MRIKGFSLIIVMAALLFAISGCGSTKLEIKTGSAERDGVTVTLDKATARKNRKTGGYTYVLSGTIRNNTDVGIMKVIYMFSLYDKKGEKFRSFAIVYDGEDKAIPPHSKINFTHDDIKWGPQSVPASVLIDIGSVKTESELPPGSIPQKGELLYEALGDEKLANIMNEPPVELAFHIDQSGYGRTAVFKGGETLDKAVSLFCKIRIGEESGEWATDNYNWISLTWKDGSDTFVSLNLRNLEYNIHSTPHTYHLDNLDEFWSYASGYLEEDEE